MEAVNADDFDEVAIEDEVDEVEPDVPSVRREIFTRTSDPTIKDLYNRYKDGDLVLDPTFQRHFVWDIAKSSRLIESVLLDVPLPIIYLAEELDGTESVIDGQQRLTSFLHFLDGEFALAGLRVLKELNGAKFTSLDPGDRKKIQRGSIRTITIQKQSDPELKFEIFERLNTGSVALNDQELRNCVFRGDYNLLLKELATDPDFMFLMNLKKPEKRMKDVEFVLRFAAFHHATYLNFKPPMKKFLNKDMEQFKNISSGDAADLRKAFKNSISSVRSLLGRNAFKRFYPGTDQNRNGYWEPQKFNASLYDVLMDGFTRYDKNQVYPHMDAIREAFIELMTTDREFVDAIELSTSSTKAVTARFDKWRLTLQGLVGAPTTEPRLFSLDLKKALFSNDATCRLCGQAIQEIDDAAIDHVEQYAQGGKTEPGNARLAHRFCNWSRPRKEN